MKLLLFRPATGQGTGADRPLAPTARPASEATVGLIISDRILEPASLWDPARGPFPGDLVSIFHTEAEAFCRDLSGRPAESFDASGRDSAGAARQARWHRLEDVEILPPVRRPGTFRDFYSFEEHVSRARARRGLSVPPEWYRRPTFYFSNPNSILGPGEPVPIPASTDALDFELEVACVIARPGRNLRVEEADDWIAGYTLLNDWSARDLQREEMAVGLGPSKGKDFATSLGPWLVTPDELRARRAGKGYDIELSATRNGRSLGGGNWKSIHFSFAEMIAHASRDVWLHPGDLIGSGTVGGGCLLEVGAEEAGGWLRPGETVTLEGGPLGVLASPVVSASP